MERKDRWTVSIASCALVVSIASGAFSYMQYSLNVDRDQREQAKALEDRTPIVTINAQRQSPARRYTLRFSFQNKDYADAKIGTVVLLSPGGLTLQPGEQPAQGEPYVPKPYAGASTDRLSADLPDIRVRGQADWYCILVVPDTIGLLPDTVAEFYIVLKFHDNADTVATIKRSVRIPWGP